LVNVDIVDEPGSISKICYWSDLNG
jgi:hypothetical protein